MKSLQGNPKTLLPISNSLTIIFLSPTKFNLTSLNHHQINQKYQINLNQLTTQTKNQAIQIQIKYITLNKTNFQIIINNNKTGIKIQINILIIKISIIIIKISIIIIKIKISIKIIKIKINIIKTKILISKIKILIIQININNSMIKISKVFLIKRISKIITRIFNNNNFKITLTRVTIFSIKIIIILGKITTHNLDLIQNIKILGIKKIKGLIKIKILDIKMILIIQINKIIINIRSIKTRAKDFLIKINSNINNKIINIETKIVIIIKITSIQKENNNLNMSM
jgi:hypothetical protein